MPSVGRESSPEAPDLRPRRWPLIVAAVSLAAAAAVVLNPIERTRIAGIAITAKDPTRPILLALAALAWYASGRRDLLARLERALGRGHLAIALTLAALTLALGLTFGSRVVWGADTYAYVTEADLWLAGHLRIPMDFVARAPWPDAITAFSPLGYRPAVDGR